MIQALPYLACAAIGYLLKGKSKPQEVKVIKQYVQDSHNYHYTQNNYTYNDNRTYNVNSNNKVRFYKKKSYQVSYHKNKRYKNKKHLRFKNNQYFLTNGNSFQQTPNYLVHNRSMEEILK